MPYKANRGGHAPEHLREALLHYLDEDSDSDMVTVGYDECAMPLRWVIGQLWNCTDVLPNDYCEIVDLAPGSTYAQAVRQMAAEG